MEAQELIDKILYEANQYNSLSGVVMVDKNEEPITKITFDIEHGKIKLE